MSNTFQQQQNGAPKKAIRVNEMIRAREIRVVYNTEQLGIMDPRDALRIAEEKGLDLVEIAPLARPPVCRIMDYGRFLYEEKKKAAEARKKQKHVVVKEIKMTLRINIHDLDTKRNHAIRFLESGAKVKLTIMLRGREVTRQDQGAEMLERIAGELGHLATIEKGAQFEGHNNLSLILAPKRH